MKFKEIHYIGGAVLIGALLFPTTTALAIFGYAYYKTYTKE